MKRRFLLFLFLFSMMFCGCTNCEKNAGILTSAASAENSAVPPDVIQTLEYGNLQDLENADSFAVVAGMISDDIVKEHYPDAEIQYYQTVVDAVLAVTSDKSDVFVNDTLTLEYIQSSQKNVAMVPELLASDHYHFILPKTSRGEQLRDEFNTWLSVLKQSGELEQKRKFWCSDVQPEETLDFKTLPNVNGTIQIAAPASSRPEAFYYNNTLSGYTIDLIYNFCRDRGYAAELSVISFDSAMMSLVTGKADIVANFISYTDERAETVLYTDCIAEGGFGALVRTVSDGNGEDPNSFRNRLIKTFVTEDRWQLILSGLGITLLITVGGFLLANILGAVFCACTMSRHKILRIVADVYDRVMQGTPIVVILLIMYYVIFGSSDAPEALVAIIAFGLNHGASLAQQFCGAVTAIDKGQTEAALAMGFTKYQAFTGIVFPQAARVALPGYFSEIITLMKSTSIVGYIAVIDLTRAGDLIRSSSYDAFFPLLSVALIYFLIAFGILSLLKLVRKKLAPKRVSAKEADK